MTSHAFDFWGWYAGPVSDGAPRSTVDAPQNTSTATTPGAMRANWTGAAWLDLPYAAPGPLPAEGASALRAELWERIKAERERRRFAGTNVGDHWFHSDDSSRIQQLALFVMGAGVPAVEWKTMSGEFVTMTQTLAAAIFTGVAAKDQALFAHAEALRAQVDAAEDPGAVDILAGWPAVFGE